MTSSSEEDASGGVEGRDGLSESVTYPRFFLVGMTSSSDPPSSLTGAGAGAGNASGTMCVETHKCVSSDLRAEALRGKTWTLTWLRTSRRGGETTNSPRLGRRLPCIASVNKGKAQDSFVRRRPSLVAGVCRSAHRAPERCDVEGKQKKSRRGARGPARGKKKLAHY